jgi:hypothetical protein
LIADNFGELLLDIKYQAAFGRQRAMSITPLMAQRISFGVNLEKSFNV